MAAENKARRGRRLPKALVAPSPVVVVYFVKKAHEGIIHAAVDDDVSLPLGV
jgi:hypothetical protein